MVYEIVTANPAGNITVFVLSSVPGKEERAALVRALLADRTLRAEQAGFVIPPAESGGVWRLEMMGGEFCGNAARSFGLYLAKERGCRGKVTIPIDISGAERRLEVEVDVESGSSWAEMPLPLEMETLTAEGLPAVVFPGIAHVLVPGRAFEEAAFQDIKRAFEAQFPFRDALGVMFYAAGMMEPAVYVYGSSSLVRESSCGSGAAALSCFLCRDREDGVWTYRIAQPGGVIEAKVTKARGRITGLAIGGKVALGERREFVLGTR